MKQPVTLDAEKKAMAPRRIAVVGAGMSGLAVAKSLLDEGLAPVIFEQAPEIGGVWTYHEERPGGGGVIYRSLHTNTSRQTFAFSDFRLSAALPDYLAHEDVLAYLHDYAVHFGLLPFLRLNTSVEGVAPLEGSRWEVRIRAGARGEAMAFDGVVICCGRENEPHIPTIPGMDKFPGRMIHSSMYQGPEEFAGRRVLVLGVGSSGADIAAEVSTSAAQVWVSTRGGTWFLPRYIRGRPYDHHLTRLALALPVAVRRVAFRRQIERAYHDAGFTVKQIRAKGLPVPAFDLWRTRFTPVGDFLTKVANDTLLIRPAIERIEGQEVVFCDHRRETVDTILFCTGYTLRLPFFAPGLVHIQQNGVELYKQVFYPALPNLAFVGLCVAAGAHPPVAEIQSRWAARVFAGRLTLPTRATMLRAIESDRSQPSRHSPIPMQVGLIAYCDEIAHLLGVRPVLWRHPRMVLRWLLGPFTAQEYRLDGPQPRAKGTARRDEHTTP